MSRTERGHDRRVNKFSDVLSCLKASILSQPVVQFDAGSGRPSGRRDAAHLSLWIIAQLRELFRAHVACPARRPLVDLIEQKRAEHVIT